MEKLTRTHLVDLARQEQALEIEVIKSCKINNSYFRPMLCMQKISWAIGIGSEKCK